MTKHINSVLVLGLGKVGHLVARLLHETGFAVTGADLHAAPTRSLIARILLNFSAREAPTIPIKPGANPHCGAMTTDVLVLKSRIVLVVPTSSVRSK